MLTGRQWRIIHSFERTGNMSETARYLGISRVRVHQVISGYKSGKLKGHCPVYYKDRGCPDGEYPSCQDCPLEKCKDDKS